MPRTKEVSYSNRPYGSLFDLHKKKKKNQNTCKFCNSLYSDFLLEVYQISTVGLLSNSSLKLCNMCAFENIFQKDSKSLDYLLHAETSDNRNVFAEDLSWIPFTLVWECATAWNLCSKEMVLIFFIPWYYNTVPQVVRTPKHLTILLPTHNFNFQWLQITI